MHTWCCYYNLRKTPSLYKSYNSVIETALSITKIKMMRNLWTLMCTCNTCEDNNMSNCIRLHVYVVVLKC
ncbi:MAG: hypothetical protein QN720_12365, partial [Nitrososphaeraceae archaeon]|nr:hypothetical protein [Nitrososphaeraceae archaeon]MDW0333733.1 hypothetical protein [Nitrososphaeraceae archaeon]